LVPSHILYEGSLPGGGLFVTPEEDICLIESRYPLHEFNDYPGQNQFVKISSTPYENSEISKSKDSN